MTYDKFKEEILNMIENGADSQGVYDLRAWRKPYDALEDCETFAITQIEDVYKFIKDSKEWYVDLYENFTDDIGYAEYTGCSVASWENNKKTDMKDSKTNAFICKAEWAEEKFNQMSLQDCIKMWNDKTAGYCRHAEIHAMDDDSWWNSLSAYLGAWHLIHVVTNSRSAFNDADDWFFYDTEDTCVCSFSTKDELIGKIGRNFFIDQIMEQDMHVFLYGREWLVLEDYDVEEDDWQVLGDLDGASLFMNNYQGYMILFEPSGRVLKAYF